jgi:F-type H+-transporting ATPase subunit epsilon
MTEPSRRFLQTEIADVSRNIFSGPCLSVVAPAAFGELCILPRHTPLLAKLQPGEVRLETLEGERKNFYVSGGYIEAQRTSVTILADQMLRSEEIDREAALEAIRQAEETLKKSHLFTERDAAKLQLVKALAQLRVLEHVNLIRSTQSRR